ncbi:MAG: VOC family protein [Pseudomonadota bacterium]
MLDHLAVAAGTLEEGVDWVETRLGVRMAPGGRHAHFGTYNALLGLEDVLYLEVIAIDPMAEGAARPRWFDLDRFSGEPRLQVWVCRTGDLPGAVQAFPDAGQAVALERGGLKWRMAVPETGILPCDNCFPALMQWQGPDHPASRLMPSGVRLRRLTVRHPQAHTLGTALAAYLSDDRVAFETGPPALSAVFETPGGPREIS